MAGASPHEVLPFWLVRWLLFRLMFASGVVKLTSRCPTWWGLTALTYHYETQCLPTPAAWFAHHLPVWLHRLSVVATFLIEIAVPPLFFAPARRLRLVLCLLQGNEPVIRLIQSDGARYPFHQQPPTYVRAQRYKYWFSQPGEQGQWWRRQWVEEFFPPVSLGDPTLDTLLRQFGLQDKSPRRARSSSNALAQALQWVRKQLSPLEAPTLLWGLILAVGAIRVLQALLGPRSSRASPPPGEEKHRPAPKKDPGAATDQAAPAPNSSNSGSQTARRKK
uniref:Lipase maturation factor n=1 Tax=Myotis myotis TaxID=51298 RepID=A0A7J7QUU0_MYOMY|nr:lipase maturation factor 2 [Myotis myotis]